MTSGWKNDLLLTPTIAPPNHSPANLGGYKFDEVVLTLRAHPYSFEPRFSSMNGPERGTCVVHAR